jgi:dTDP-4-amino-4,6-dideoxygalactose transaminase
MITIPFNNPYITGNELVYIAQAHANHILAGDGPFTKLCEKWLEAKTKAPKTLMTHSCTAALEMSALLLDIKPGDEIIMPSYTFVSTANAFVIRGGVPVFVDIRNDTLNLNQNLIEDAITSKTKIILPVHYAGVSCEMDTICALANNYQLRVVEDAAQAILSTYKGKYLGTIGDLGAFSFHETKNIISGEGGCLLINNSDYIFQSEIIREKGTNRSRFFRGEIDKYTWESLGSSYLPGELVSAFLWAQLSESERITTIRKETWGIYHELLESLELKGLIKRPYIPQECAHNGHMYYVVLSRDIKRDLVLSHLKANGISCVFHYVPLHSSPAGKKYGRTSGNCLPVTDFVSNQLIRLPLFLGLTRDQQIFVSNILENAINAQL